MRLDHRYPRIERFYVGGETRLVAAGIGLALAQDKFSFQGLALVWGHRWLWTSLVLYLAMRHAAEIFQELEDLSPNPTKVRNYAAIWDGPLGFIYQVLPDNAAEFARRLRALADTVEGFQGQR